MSLRVEISLINPNYPSALCSGGNLGEAGTAGSGEPMTGVP